MEEITCSYKDLFHVHRTLEYLCVTASVEQCAEDQDFVNFFKLFWCHLNGNLILFVILALLLIFFIFKYTGVVVDEYIAEAIEELTEWLGMSEALSAVTLLAFANGAGDVITALIAGDSEGGVSYNIGALYGAGLFVCSMVVGLCILQNGEPLIFDKMIIYRDIGFYIVSTIATIAFAFFGEIVPLFAAIYLIIYLILVIFVVVTESYGDDDPDVITNKESLMASLTIKEPEAIEDDDQTQEVQEKKIEVAKIKKKIEVKKIKKQKKVGFDARGKFQAAVRMVMTTNYLKSRLEYKRTMRHELPLSEKPFVDQILTVLDYPFDFVLYLTVAPCNEHEYTRTRGWIFPILGFPFYYLVAMKTVDMNMIYFGLIPGLVLALLLFLTLPKDGTMPGWYMLHVCFSIIGGLVWTTLLVGLLVDLLNCLGIILNLDKTFLGLTILAIGNALADALTTMALVKEGLGTLAISGGYAGQLFGLLIGFGLSMLKVTIQKGPQSFDLFNLDRLNENMLSIIVLGVSFIVLIFTYVFGIVNKFRMTRGFAWVLIGIYLLFVLGSTIFAVQNAIRTA